MYAEFTPILKKVWVVESMGLVHLKPNARMTYGEWHHKCIPHFMCSTYLSSLSLSQMFFHLSFLRHIGGGRAGQKNPIAPTIKPSQPPLSHQNLTKSPNHNKNTKKLKLPILKLNADGWESSHSILGLWFPSLYYTWWYQNSSK